MSKVPKIIEEGSPLAALDQLLTTILKNSSQEERDQLAETLEKWKVRTMTIDALQEAKDQKEEVGSFKIEADKYIALLKIIEDACLNGKMQDKPELLILMGGTGVGKTTIRNQKYHTGWVIADPNDIFQAVKKTIGPEGDIPYVYIAGVEILKRAISEKRNIVIEVVGDKFEPLKHLLDSMEAIGYKPQVQAIINDIEKSFENNVNRSKDNISAAFTQDEVYSWFNSALKDLKK